MIISIVAAIAISQREARRKKAEQQAELEAAARKSVVFVSAGTSGLVTAFLLSQLGHNPFNQLLCHIAATSSNVFVTLRGTYSARLAPTFATAFLLSQLGFSVDVVDEREEVDVMEHQDALTVVPAMSVELMVKAGRLEPHEEFAKGLEEIGGGETLVYRRYKSSKSLLTTPLSSTFALVVPTEDLHSLLSDYTKARLHANTKIISYHDSPEELDDTLPTGRPYALAENGKKFYAELIIVCHDGGIARKHVCETAGCDEPQSKPT